MTKTVEVKLRPEDRTYFLDNRKFMCSAFVTTFLGRHPEQVKVKVSTDPLVESIVLMVTKQGFYRWSWRVEGDTKMYGMYVAAEDVLCNLFPEAKDDCLDKERTVWVNVAVS